MEKLTPGPWRVGKGSCVVSDVQPWADDQEEVNYYGGHLICESVNGPNSHLIAAAPDLLEACKEALSAMFRLNFATSTVAPKLAAAIQKANGEVTR